ncbi:TPA: phosphorylcholine transferase LicD [Streptococcus suis]
MEKKILEKLQQVETDILNVIVKICEDNNIDYFLVGGTLLGAIRHKGFIPWDDDLDIAMPRKDYDRFVDICLKKLPKEYFIHCKYTDDNYWLPFIKIRKKGTVFEERPMVNIETHKGIFVDVFPLDNANKQKSSLQFFQAYLSKKISGLIMHKRGLDIGQLKLINSLVLKITKSISIRRLSDIRDKIMTLNKNEKSEYYINIGSNYNFTKQTIPKNKYFPLTLVEFEGNNYKAPKDWDYVLKRIYGDYMKLPPEDKRVTHNPVRLKFEGEDEIIF